MVSNIGTIVSMETGNNEIQYLRQFQKKYEDNTIDGLKCAFIMKYIVLPLTLAYIIFASWFSYKYMGEPQIIAILIINFLVLNSILVILESNKILFFKWGMLKNALDSFEVCEADRQGGYEMTDASIEFRDVSYSYPNGKVVFDHLNLIIPSKEITLIHGHIGIGKSTFIALVTKKLKPQSGIIMLPKNDRIFVVPQTPRLFARTLYENIVYGKDEIPSKEEVIELIHKLNLIKGFLNKLPEGLDTKVGVMGSRLSGGQRQIVHIVRLFLSNPDIIILDEPTSALDVDTKKIVMDLLVNAMKDRTVIMVTHDEALKEYANHVIHL
jgi:ABC-type multidrug transport system fused ATPase/permease subunit